jgi:hypothetical protein
MTGLSLVMLVILLLFQAVGLGTDAGFVADDGPVYFGVGAALTATVLSAIKAVLLAPFAIAVHRFVLLGEVTARYRIDPADQRFLRFAFYGVLLAVLTMLPHLLGAVFALMWRSFGGFVSFVLHIVVAVIGVRVAILFPAVAVDATDPTWQHAIDDTKGHSWRVFFVLLVTALGLVPFAALLIGPFAAAAVDQDGFHFGIAAILTAIGSAIVTLIATAVLVAAASRLYRALSATLG